MSTRAAVSGRSSQRNVAHGPPTPPAAAAGLATPDNVERLVRIITSEASVENETGRAAVAWTVRNPAGA